MTPLWWPRPGESPTEALRAILDELLSQLRLVSPDEAEELRRWPVVNHQDRS